DMESRIGITSSERWHPAHLKWIETNTYIKERVYRRALDKLELLVIQCLFEMEKLNMRGTGYKLRGRLLQAFQRRSRAVQTAVNTYNSAATAFDPPRQAVSFKEVIDLTFLGAFDLLRFARTDIRNRRWTNPAIREAMVDYFRLQRAKEEIIRLNIEARRLRTWVDDEDSHYRKVIDSLQASNPLLAAEIKVQY
ncbi:hypothetical protein BOTBODRAFT_98234, partial [Botryobasidium botryosum FD-172 SS1]